MDEERRAAEDARQAAANWERKWAALHGELESLRVQLEAVRMLPDLQTNTDIANNFPNSNPNFLNFSLKEPVGTQSPNWATLLEGSATSTSPSPISAARRSASSPTSKL